MGPMSAGDKSAVKYAQNKLLIILVVKFALQQAKKAQRGRISIVLFL
jgi:hypothetical protein